MKNIEQEYIKNEIEKARKMIKDVYGNCSDGSYEMAYATKVQPLEDYLNSIKSQTSTEITKE